MNSYLLSSFFFLTPWPPNSNQGWARTTTLVSFYALFFWVENICQPVPHRNVWRMADVMLSVQKKKKTTPALFLIRRLQICHIIFLEIAKSIIKDTWGSAEMQFIGWTWYFLMVVFVGSHKNIIMMCTFLWTRCNFFCCLTVVSFFWVCF